MYEISRSTRLLCLGLVSLRVRWGLSARGWSVLALATIIALFGFAFGVYRFLALNDRVDAQVLVVEGWVHPYAIEAAIREFNSGKYEKIVTTGGPVEGLGQYLNDYSTSAAVAASRLRAAGFDPTRLAVAPSRAMDRDRTYGAAMALREWLRVNAPEIRSVNVLTADLHARRSRLLFAAALGKHIHVGVIAVPSPDYDSKHWWRYSEGVRAVLGETVSYLYAKFIFVPDSNSEPSASL